MNHPFSGSNYLWVLFACYKEYDDKEAIPSEIFDNPKDCFEKYPKNWKKIDKAFYFLGDCSEIKKYNDAEHLKLIPVRYFSKKV